MNWYNMLSMRCETKSTSQLIWQEMHEEHFQESDVKLRAFVLRLKSYLKGYEDPLTTPVLIHSCMAGRQNSGQKSVIEGITDASHP